MPYYYFVTAAFAGVTLVLWWRKASRRSIAYLPSPPSSSWLAGEAIHTLWLMTVAKKVDDVRRPGFIGNMPDFVRPQQAFEANFDWTKKYGKAFRFKGCLGEDILYISDPKALQHILNKSGYNYLKPREILVGVRFIAGNGLAAVEGTDHARHRRVMNPAFSHSALKEFVPLFLDISWKTATVWKAEIHRQNGLESVLDVSSLLTRTSLDAIGEAALNYKFDSVDSGEPKTELERVYRNLFFDTSYMPPDSFLAFSRMLGYVPFWLSDIIAATLPFKPQRRIRYYVRVVRSAAKQLLEKAMDAHANGKIGGKDVMSVLIKANFAEDPKRRLQEGEVIAQMTTFLLAGHETTANTVSWTLYELSRHPEVQSKLREEIINVLSDVAARGDSVMTTSDMDSMKYMGAVMKETLRYDAIFGQITRYAGRDDVIPLDTPQRTISGDTVTSIPVRQGQMMHLGLCSYNRLPEVWGEDADQWRPERFLDNSLPVQTVNLGVFGNIATFGGGLHGCIGWRFSLIEMQAILIHLIRNFEFRPAPGVEIRFGMNGGLMQPMVKGQEDKGTQLPLLVSIVPDGDTV